MLHQYGKFLNGVVTLLKLENKPSGLASPSAGYIPLLLRAYEKVKTMGGILMWFLLVSIFHFFCNLEDWRKPRNWQKIFVCGIFSNSMKLWLLRVSVGVRHFTRDSISPSKADLLSIFELLKDVLARVSISEAENLWLMALKFFANQKHYFDKLVEISVRSLTKNGGNEQGFSLSAAIMHFVLQKDGVLHAREIYKRFIPLPHPGPALYRACIELESNLASISDKDSLINARKLYESALKTYDQDLSLWRDYYLMETKVSFSSLQTSTIKRTAISIFNKFVS
ncbi:putative tetratricopeptide-like helical domain-containing protein [Rosa chinensis]|uniref:Putative tetratricopeptide-like helical domain-containing protein n=1 Tax=Rosa chinensis TaxID=74649 RepID=A0A2P6PDP9_ROSCH|nr:uncharacterized protein LOC112175958 [Rosa chinensis]PRQ20054.1 putative tetratricopeptide-like helical domain-containing protein [Rosa chinensis]